MLEVGQSTNVLIESFASALLSNLTFAVRLPTDRLTGLTANNLIPSAASATLDVSQPNLALFNFAALPGQSLAGTQQIARLNFTAPPGQSSAFIPLTFNGVAAQRAQPGLAPTVLLNSGRVVAVGGQPLLEAFNGSGGPRVLTLYGRTGTNYLIETSSIPASAASWHVWRAMTATNLLESMPASAAPNAPLIFYRARQ